MANANVFYTPLWSRFRVTDNWSKKKNIRFTLKKKTVEENNLMEPPDKCEGILVIEDTLE